MSLFFELLRSIRFGRYFNGCVDVKGVVKVVLMKVLWSVMVVVILGLQYRLWFGSGSFSEVAHLEEKVAMQQDANELLRERNEQLNADVLDLKNGFDAIEERARFSLGMVARDETFYMVVTSKL